MSPASVGARGPARRLSVAAGAALLVSLTTLAARVIGFGRTLVFSATVGNTAVGAAYNRANLVPNVLFEVVAGGVLAAVVVPLLAPGLARADAEGRRQADDIAGALLTWVLTLLVPLAVLIALLARPIACALIGGSQASSGAVDLGADLLRLFAVQLPLYGVGAVLGGVLHAHRRFLWPALAPLLSSLVVIGAYLAFATRLHGDTTGLSTPSQLAVGPRWLLGAGTTLGVAALTLPLLWPARRAGVRLRPRWRMPAGTVGTAAALAGAGIVGVIAQQVAVVTVATATKGVDGGRVLTLVGYAQAVTLMPHAVLVVPLITVVFPRIATAAAAAEPRRLSALVAVSTRMVLTAGLLGAAGQVAVAAAVQRFFTGLDRAGVEGLGWGLVAYAPGVAAFGLITHLSRVLSATHRARAVAVGVASAWAVAALGSLSVLLPGVGADAALAVLGAANSAGMLLGAALLLLSVRAHLGPGACAGLARVGVGGVLAAATAAAVGAVTVDAMLRAPGQGRVADVIGGGLAGVGGAVVVVVAFSLVALATMRAQLIQAVHLVRGGARGPGAAPAGRSRQEEPGA